jgi:DNA-binding transcriptional LysR family regulator
VPVPEIRLYWHKRHDRNPAHRWLRERIFDAVKPFHASGSGTTF